MSWRCRIGFEAGLKVRSLGGRKQTRYGFRRDADPDTTIKGPHRPLGTMSSAVGTSVGNF